MKYSRTTMLPIHKNLGLSLVELMISMTLGLSLIGGLMSMYLSTQKTDKSRTELSDIDSNARVALKSLRQIIQHAGYRSVENLIRFEKPFYSERDGTLTNQTCRSGSGNTITNTNLISHVNDGTDPGYTKDKDTGDMITVMYLADHPKKGDIFLDCAGGNYSGLDAKLVGCSTDTAHTSLVPDDAAEGIEDPIKAVIYSSFYLKTEAGEPKQLVCHGSRTATSDPAYIIADNIENMQFLYGVDSGVGTTYKNATDVDDNFEWEAVTSVQVAILVGSNKLNVLENAKARTYQLLDKPVSILGTDRRMYKVYETTITLHNRLTRGF